jgi:hypothetical protein
VDVELQIRHSQKVRNSAGIKFSNSCNSEICFVEYPVEDKKSSLLTA